VAGADAADLSVLLATLPAARSPLGRAVFDHIAAVRGQIGSAQLLARRVGLVSRHQLHRRLQRDGLPSAHRLAGWARILAWVVETERTGRSLFDIAIRAGLDPPTCYRTVTRITHAHWSTVCKNGSKWVLLRFLDQCKRVAPAANVAAEQAS